MYIPSRAVAPASGSGEVTDPRSFIYGELELKLRFSDSQECEWLVRFLFLFPDIYLRGLRCTKLFCFHCLLVRMLNIVLVPHIGETEAQPVEVTFPATVTVKIRRH